MVTSVAQGVPVTAVAGNGTTDPEANTQGVVVPADSDIKSIADMEGKTLGVIGVRSGSDLGVLLAAEAAGIDPDSITQVAVPPSGMQAALESGSVDAVMSLDPFYSQMLDAGFVSIGNYTAEYAAFVPVTVWAATNEWVAANPETASKFAEAMTMAVEFYNDPSNLDAVKAITAEVSQLDVSEVSDNYQLMAVPFDKEASVANLADLARLGYIDTEISFEDVVWDNALTS